MRIAFITDDFLIEPLGIGYLSSYLKCAGHEVNLLKTNDPEFSDIVNDPPDMLCYSVTTGSHRRYYELNRLIRQSVSRRVYSVFGGPHITFFPEFCKQDYVDAGVRGEGFDAIVDVADAFERNRSARNIPNVVVKGSVAPLRPLKNKDMLLLPDREVMYKYERNFLNPIKDVMCSFMCQYDCPYCYAATYKEMYGQTNPEIRSVDSVIEEVRDLMAYPLSLIFFQDDIFPIYRDDWLHEFARKYRAIGVPFHIQIRPEFVKRDKIKQLKEVGLHGVTFAIESGNPELRRDVLKRRMKDEIIIGAAWTLKELGIKLRTENMVGVPGETWRTAMQTVKLNGLCEPTIAWASLFQPYPGTALGDACLADGTFDGDLDSMSGTFFETYRLKVKGRRKYERLHKLFSFFVKHRRLSVFARLVCSLPFRYRGFYRWYKNRLYGNLFRLGGT